jgi:hypothetical protein
MDAPGGGRNIGGGGGVPPGLVMIPNRNQLEAFNVFKPGMEVYGESLYDSAAYAAAGQSFLSFFTQALGQGTGVGGGPKTFSDTNMESAPGLPSGQEFLIQTLDIIFEATIPSVTAGQPAVFGAQLVDTAINDAWIFWRQGNLQLFIGSKAYCQEAPLMKFPPKAFFGVDAALADSTTAGANQQSRIGVASARGPCYKIVPWILLVSNVNFKVLLSWPEGVAAIVNPGRAFVSLGGLHYRNSQ